MTSSFERAVHAKPWPEQSGKAPVAARFIPRENIGSYAAWSPSALSSATHAEPAQAGQAPHAATPAPERVDPHAALEAARQAAYQEGYRDGLAALEGFRHSQAQQLSGQLGALLASFGDGIEALEGRMAEVLAETARDLACQIVRHELSVQPELVATVAHEAVTSLLLSARHVTLRVHPDDHELVVQGMADELERRGARLIDDASISRGGCVVESDVGVVNARIESRWSRAAAALAGETEWTAA